MRNVLMRREEVGGAGGGGKGGGGGGSQRAPREAANDLRSTSVARIIDLISEGPIVGLVNGLRSIYLDNTPLVNADGSTNFGGVVMRQRTGEPDQSYIPGFPSVETASEISTQVFQANPVVRTISNPEIDASRVTLQIPQLSFQDPKTGDIKRTSVRIAIDVRAGNGSWINRVDDTITGKTNSPYQRSYRVALPAGDERSVRVRRITADSQESNRRNDVWWATLTEIIDAKLIYPDSALIALEIDAQQFGSRVPQRSYRVRGRIIQVPSNYNPTTRAYSGIWDGTFKLAWSDNPAWVYYDLATHLRYGAALENVDKWELYELAQYCDELVPNGYGGTEPRFTFNSVLASREDAFKALATLASAFRGMTYWGTNSVMAVADRPADPVKIVSPANVKGGDFERQGSGLKARHSVALVSWNDPADNYRLQTEVVEDADAIRQYGWRQKDVTAVGCTSRGQAHRLGRWILASERLETETLSYTAGPDNADLRPGDIIAVSDPSRAAARMAGRLLATGTEQLTLDAVPEQVAGSQWFLDVRVSGGLERRAVAAFDGNQVTLTEPFSEAPVHGAMWLLSAGSIDAELFRVLSVDEVDGHEFTVTALTHEPGKYALVEQGLALPERDTTLLPTGPLPPPRDIVAQEFLYQAGPVVRSGVSLSWRAPTDPRVSQFELEVERPGEAGFAAAYFGADRSADLLDTEPGQFRVRVRSVSAVIRSTWHTASLSLQGLLMPPADVADLRISVNSGQVLLEWPAVPTLNLSHYRIRYNAATVGATWGNSQDVIDRVAAGTTSVMLPARRGTYLIKAVTYEDVASLNATRAISNIADLIGTNVVEEIDEGPVWAGEHGDTLALNGALQLGAGEPLAAWMPLAHALNLTHGVGGVASEGYYQAAETVDLGHVYPCRLAGELQAVGFDILGVMAGWSTLAQVEQLDMSDVSQWAVELQVSTSSTELPDPPGDWSDWTPFKVGEYTARAFRFRLRLRSFAAAITPRVTHLLLMIDMPDRIADGQDMLCPPGGLRVAFSPAFMARPSLAVDAQGLAPGDRKLITNIDDTGFDVRFFDADDNGVARTFDYLAKGYGRRVAA